MMFNLLYIFLYKYSYFLNKPHLSFNKNFLLKGYICDNNFLNTKYNFLLKQNFFKNKKCGVFLLKKKYFFFKFINKQNFLIKKLVNASFSRVNSMVLNKISSCFKTLDSRRPLKSLYYKISRSRAILPFFLQNMRSSKKISYFLNNFGNMDSSIKIKKNLFFFLTTPLFLVSNKINIFFFLSIYFFFKKKIKSKRKLFSLLKKKFISKKKYYFIKNIILTKITKKRLNLKKKKAFLNLYSLWLSIPNISFFANKNETQSYLTDKSIVFNSKLTNTSILKNINKNNISKKNTILSSVVNFYNIRTYNWLIIT